MANPRDELEGPPRGVPLGLETLGLLPAPPRRRRQLPKRGETLLLDERGSLLILPKLGGLGRSLEIELLLPILD